MGKFVAELRDSIDFSPLWIVRRFNGWTGFEEREQVMNMSEDGSVFVNDEQAKTFLDHYLSTSPSDIEVAGQGAWSR